MFTVTLCFYRCLYQQETQKRKVQKGVVYSIILIFDFIIQNLCSFYNLYQAMFCYTCTYVWDIVEKRKI